MVCAAFTGGLFQISQISMYQRRSGWFDFLKEGLTTIPILAYPDTSKLYILCTDVSDDCIGARLCQKQDAGGKMKSTGPNEKPIYHLSQKLTAYRQTGLQLKNRL